MSPTKCCSFCYVAPISRLHYSLALHPDIFSESEMLDAFKNITSGRGKLVHKQADELAQLIASAREERSAVSTMLTVLETRSAKLTPLSKSLEQVTEKAAAVTTRLDEISKRLTALDDQ